MLRSTGYNTQQLCILDKYCYNSLILISPEKKVKRINTNRIKSVSIILRQKILVQLSLFSKQPNHFLQLSKVFMLRSTFSTISTTKVELYSNFWIWMTLKRQRSYNFMSILPLEASCG